MKTDNEQVKISIYIYLTRKVRNEKCLKSPFYFLKIKSNSLVYLPTEVYVV